MPSAARAPWWRRVLAALLALVLAVVAAVVAVRLYAARQLEQAERLHVARLEAQRLEPPASSAASLELTRRCLAAARELYDRWYTPGRGVYSELPELSAEQWTELEPQLELFLAAAELPLAHELLRFHDGSEGMELMVAVRLVEGAAEEAAHWNGEAYKLRSARALAEIASGYHRTASLGGLLLASSAQRQELTVLQRLVEQPETSLDALGEIEVILAVPPPPIRSSFAGEVLGMYRSDLLDSPDHRAGPLVLPLHRAMMDLYRSRLLQVSTRFELLLNRPLVELLTAEPRLEQGKSHFDILAESTLNTGRHALIQARTLEAARQLGREALAARGDGEPIELTRPELLAAYDRYWGIGAGEPVAQGAERTRRLLTWRVPG